jgi:hypothetical protein
MLKITVINNCQNFLIVRYLTVLEHNVIQKAVVAELYEFEVLFVFSCLIWLLISLFKCKICQIRISAHELAIEKEIYSNLPRNNRFCSACDANFIEDEEHFLLHCTAYTEIRDKLLKELKPNITNLRLMDTNAKLHLLLNNSSLKTLILSSSFIFDCLNIRKSLLC